MSLYPTLILIFIYLGFSVLLALIVAAMIAYGKGDNDE